MEDEKPKKLAEVNVEEGFLPKFAEAFVKHYGINSMFVRATSDYLTNALAKLLTANNMLSSEKIASYAPAEATEALRVLMQSLISVHGRKIAGQALLDEAFELKPIGSFQNFVDSTHATGCFQRWHEAIEAEQYQVARLAVPQS